MPPLPGRRSLPPRAAGCAVLLCGVLLAGACTDGMGGSLGAQSTSTSVTRPTPTQTPELQPDDVVDLTVYLRAGEGATAHLEPVVREVAVDDDLPRRALELLLAGPAAEEDGLSAPLPTSTQVRSLVVEGGTARVDLSSAVVRDASSVGGSPGNELLALAALANTLTEFPSIERVVLTVDGQDAEGVDEFWGGWGIPEVLVRDESLVGANPSEGHGLADLTRFTVESQEVGSSEAGTVRIAGIRVRDRIGHSRITIELADGSGAEAAPKVPPVRARTAGSALSMLLLGVTAASESAEDLHADLAAHGLDVEVEADDLAGSVRIVLPAAEARPFWLHTLTNPTRIVLDVKK